MYKSGTSDAARLRFRDRLSTGHPWVSGEYVLLNRYEMITFNHARTSNGSWLDGGPFYLRKETHNCTSRYAAYGSPHTFEGHVILGPIFTGGTAAKHQTEQSSASRLADGATAIARVAPTVPEFSLATQFGELRERFPSIIGSSLMRDQVATAKKAGSEYLNVEFGWKPIVSAVQDFARAIKHGNSTVLSYDKQSKKRTRRRYDFPTVQSFSQGSGNNQLRPEETGGSLPGSWHEIRSSSKWFVGAWIYYVPVGDSLRAVIQRSEQKANQLLGTRLTPSVLWEIAPWSWAADWFTNMGDIMTNISAIGSDRLVMRYGYIMHNNLTLRKQYCKSNTTSLALFREDRYETKMRLEASPYGFGIDWDGMSPRQIAIATAVGLTRS
jgi:hypothetical protein